MHRHHHPPGRRYRPHGGRVLLLRAHAGAGDAARERRRNCCSRPCSCSASPIRRSPSTIDAPKEPVYFEGDGRLIAQALTNVLKNAGEGIAARIAKGDDAPGQHRHRARAERRHASPIRVTDNGIGLPPEHRHRLTEPYVTTRAKGTGLGLAIVRKIMEDHGGEIALRTTPEGGEGAEVVSDLPAARKRT